MWPFDRMKVRFKLALLAGVPVLGAMMLSALIARDAQERAQTVAALGSIEDLASLTESTTALVYELQQERARLAYNAGIGRPGDERATAEQRRTTLALESLERFFGQRDESKLPAKLKRELATARQRLSHLHERRAKAEQEGFRIDEHLGYYSEINDSLIGATAALTQLTSDGETLMIISRLVATLQVIERSSRQHALLSYVFGKREFPPGTFRSFVTLITDRDAYMATFRIFEDEAGFRRIQAKLEGPHARQIEAMRKAALETTDEELTVDAAEWFETQRRNLQAVSGLTAETLAGLRLTAAGKVAAARQAIRLGIGLVLGVLVISALLAAGIARSTTRSVRVLVEATEAVQRDGDFEVRARKTSRDELGLLTDAFNDMLAGIQERDRELRAHRENLERAVVARTRELSQRNEQMRLVLDNVEQGLVTIDREGKLSPECSRAFERWFGEFRPGTSFGFVLAPHDLKAKWLLEMSYQQLIEDVLPVELALDQMPKLLVRGDRHYALSFTPVLHDGKMDGALLVARDVSAEIAARHADAVQREKIRAFEHVMRDRHGFLEFFGEAQGLVERIRDGGFDDRVEEMRAIHTLKGIAAVFDLDSVVGAAHELEQALADGERGAKEAALAELLARWHELVVHVAPVLDDDASDGLVVSRCDLEALLAVVRSRATHETIERRLARLEHEPAELRLKRIEEQLKRLARRLGKPEPAVSIDAGEVRIPAAFRTFWSSFAHVIRNVVDHGMQTEAERAEQGKPPQNRIELRAREDGNALIFELADDGRGIDWNLLEGKARGRGLPCETRAELARALFAGGVSTAYAVTYTSGRGVGMSAVREVCAALNGEIFVESELGRGTRFRFVFPLLEHSGGEVLRIAASRAPIAAALRRANGDATLSAISLSVRPRRVPSA
jgi:two-component system chemotaxis sensor kinase CheA